MKGLQVFKNKILKNDIHYVTSDYKTRNTLRPTHTGIDVVSYNGKSTCTDYIVAVHKGIVTRNEYSATGSGYWVEVRHPSGVCSRYLHMKKGTIKVKVGDNIETSQVIGYMGASGVCSGAHLHFSIYEDGKCQDPLPYLNDEKLFEEKEPVPSVYIVKGDTIQDIAKETGVSVDDICEANGIVDFRIYVGQELIIPKTRYIIVNTKSGVWTRLGGYGLDKPKYKVVPNKTKCVLLQKDVGTADGYNWDKIIYQGKECYIPNKWNLYE